MTERARGRCAWCGRPLELGRGPGRPPRYCRRSCRQRAYESRLRMHELGATERELAITRRDLEVLRDQLFEFSLAVEDVERGLRAGASGSEALSEMLTVVQRFLQSVADSSPTVGFDPSPG